jgi:hypothetical protein
MESRPTSKLPTPTVIVAAALLAAVFVPALHAQSPWESAVNVLQISFTGPIARGLSLIHCDWRYHLRLRRGPKQASPGRHRLRRRDGDRCRQLHGLAVSLRDP